MSSRPRPPPGPKTCIHLEHGWFDPKVGLPPRPLLEPQDVLEELLRNLIVSGNTNDDATFLSGLLESASKHRATTKTEDPPQFHQFSRLPLRIRNQIWLFAIPSRTVHVSVDAQEKACWNRRLPIPAPALACREAWLVIMPLVHDVTKCLYISKGPGGCTIEDSWPVVKEERRVSWFTSADTLSVGGAYYTCETLDWFYGRNVPITADTAIPLRTLQEQVNITTFFQSHNCLKVVLQTIDIVVAKTAKTSGKFSRVKDGVMAFRNPVSFVNVKGVKDWSRHERDSVDRDVAFGPPPNFGFHVAHCVELHDRARLEELLSLVSAMGGSSWDTCAGKHRLDAMEDWTRAFCFDCLMTWWEKRGRDLTEETFVKHRRQEMETRNTIGDEPKEADEVDARMPRLIPTVRFLVRFQDTVPPGTPLAEPQVRMLAPHLDFETHGHLPDWMINDFEDDL
ncbi:hypothetical protein QIS74_06472 [Colletotrichum tabaci]|uniref:2EXR domain-containing protein n=1 Tax=Colletotrichum tabaci TaxID=1209068 RepID=A0AAV9TEV5_9PEZI